MVPPALLVCSFYQQGPYLELCSLIEWLLYCKKLGVTDDMP